jgi:hypothetical protein
VSAYVLGKGLMDSLKIFAFEFVRDYVLKGLTPHTEQGNPYQPAEVVYDFVARLEHELARQDELAWNLTGPEREDYIATHILPLQDRIQNYRDYLDCIQDYTWAEWGLPHDYELASSFIRTLVNSHYLKEEACRFLPWPVKSSAGLQGAMPSSKPPTLPHSQNCKLKCRKIAKRIWEQDPILTIAEMIKQPEITENSRKLNGMPFSKSTVRNWIGCLCPHQRLGRPLKKSKKVNVG